jgi:hypothetical protein
MQIINCQQGKDEWFWLRLCCVTGTGFKKVMAKGSGKTRSDYMDILIEEYRTLEPRENIVTDDMRNGTDWEPVARLVYAAIKKTRVSQVGFVIYSDFVGISPDGLVGDDGIIEIKCPRDTTHAKYLAKRERYAETSTCPPEYKAQVQGLLWVLGRKWLDFVSYHPAFDQSCMIVRVERDEEYIDRIENETNRFVEELKGRLK